MRILLLIIFLLIVNCKFNKVVDSHGVHYLDKKQQSLTVNKSNKNDIIVLLGPPSTKSKFDNDLWIYIERKKTRTTLLKLGKKKIFTNNVLLLEIDSKGLLAKKKLLDIDDMKEVKFIDDVTDISYSKKSFVYDFLSSMRQKVNDPLGVRANKRKKTRTTLLKLGKKKIFSNNVLLLEIDSKGLLAKKELLDINDMKEVIFVDDITDISYSKKSFVYDFLSSMRQKINDPLGVRAKKRKKINQQ